MGFFKDIRGMLKSEYEGRYLAHVISLIGKKEPQILALLIGQNIRTNEITCDLEYKHKDDRRADMIIRTKNIEVLVEIKAQDGGSNSDSAKEVRDKNFHNNEQLKDYIAWMRDPEAGQIERRLVLLNKYPSVSSIKKTLDELSEEDRTKIVDLTYSDFAETLRKAVDNNKVPPQYVNLLFEYFSDEGLVMFEFKPEDVDAFTSFMVLNFLPHVSGHGKQAAWDKIARGPEIFSLLVKNWQLTSELFSQTCGMSRTPTIKYWAHQEYSKSLENADYNDSFARRETVRQNKLAGTWTIFSNSSIAKVDERNINFEYGIEYKISKRKKETSEDNPVEVKLYCVLLFKQEPVGFNEVILKDGLTDDCFKTSHKLALKIAKLANKTIDAILVQPDPDQLHSDIKSLKVRLEKEFSL